MVERTLVLFLFTCFPFLQSVADDGIALRNCRMASPHHQAIAKRAAADRMPGGDFYHGERRQLVVLAAFSDKAFRGDEASTLTQWDKIFNQEHLTEAPFKGSVHDYFYDQSYGQLQLTFDLQYVTLGKPEKQYASSATDDENSKYLVSDIVDQLLTRDIDWSQYDWNGDGFVNQLLIIFAGKGMNAGGGSSTIWPHQWWLSEHDNFQARTFQYGGKQYTVDSYCCVQELYSDNGYGTFGTICHEYSHCFGLPDFYNGSTSYIRHWDLMDYGNNNGGGFLPCGYSAHERMVMGWLTPTELTTGTTVSDMPSLTDEPQAYLVRNDGYPSEYYIIENRQQTGWDESLPASGIVVFHIDYDPQLWCSITEMVNTAGKRRYTIFPANNRTSYSYESGWAYPNGTNNLLTDTSSPAATLLHDNVDGQKLMSKPITDMTVSEGQASFLFMDGQTSVRQPSMDNGQWSMNGQWTMDNGQCYDLHGRQLATPFDELPKGIYIVRQNGTTRTVKR